MKTHRPIWLPIVLFALTFSFGLRAYAVEPPREELVHAYILLKAANHDYGGHRVAAMKEIEVAGRELGLDLAGRGVNSREKQMKSDELVAESGSLLHDARDRLAAKDRERVAKRVEKAILEVDAALKTK